MTADWFDIVLFLPLVWGLVRGLYKGLVVSMGSLVGLVVGIYAGSLYASEGGRMLQQGFQLEDGKAHAIAFFLIFFVVTLATFFVAKLIDRFLKIVTLSWLNRCLGALFGLVKYALVLSVLINLMEEANNYVPFIPQDKVKTSVLYQPLRAIVPSVLPYVKFYMDKPWHGTAG